MTESTTDTLDLIGLAPAEIDAAWAEAMKPAIQAEQTLARLRKQVKSRQESGAPDWKYATGLAELEAQEQDAYEAYQQALQAREPFDAEWTRRGGWTRFWLVPGGHLHRGGGRSMVSCHTLTPGQTLIGLLTEASGLTDAEVVERFNYTACTLCFPDAPVEAELSLADQGFCEHSGEYVPEDRLPKDWHHYAVAPGVRCPCGWRGAITKTGKYRKHRPRATDG